MSRYQPEEIRLIGSRMKSARTLTTLNQVQFCEKYGLTLAAVKTWETGKFAPRLKNLEEYCCALGAEGVFNIGTEWFLAGEGPSPTLLKGTSSHKTSAVLQDNALAAKQIEKEIALFQQNQIENKRVPVVASIADNLMSPVFLKDDIVGGILFEHKPNKKMATKRPCLIETQPSHFAARWLLSDGKNLFMKNSVEQELIKISKQRIAKILWHRAAL